MFTNDYDLKYETPYNVPFEITQWCTNGIVVLQYGAKQLYI